MAAPAFLARLFSFNPDLAVFRIGDIGLAVAAAGRRDGDANREHAVAFIPGLPLLTAGGRNQTAFVFEKNSWLGKRRSTCQY